MQNMDSLRDTAPRVDSPAIAVAIMNASIGMTAPGSARDSTHGPKHGSTHEPKAKTAGPQSPQSDDARGHGSDRITPERIRTSSNLMSPNLMSSHLTGPDLMRAETLAATLATLRSESETLTEVAHDARNMVTALGLYCEFLEEPGVLATPFLHYGQELRLVAAASRRLVEKIVALDYKTNAYRTNSYHTNPETSAKTNAIVSAESVEKMAIPFAGLTPAGLGPSEPNTLSRDADSGFAQQAQTATGIAAVGLQREPETFSNPNRRWDLLPTVPVADLAAELAVNRNLLAALAGPSIALTVHAEGCARPVWLSGEDLTRVLVNLVKNSAEAMLSGGTIDIRLREIGLREIALREQPAEKLDDQEAAACLLLTVEDDGPGIPAEAEESIFASGFTSHGASEGSAQLSKGNYTLNHRGLGLTISRSIVEGAGGHITAANREQGGARFALELPLRQAN
jgi:signal transduction histidine kinase